MLINKHVCTIDQELADVTDKALADALCLPTT